MSQQQVVSSGVGTWSRSSRGLSSTTASSVLSTFAEDDDDDYSWSSFPDLPSPGSSGSLSSGGSRVLSNRATDSEILFSLPACGRTSTGGATGIATPSSEAISVSKTEVVLLGALILFVLALFSLPVVLHFYVQVSHSWSRGVKQL